MVDARLPERWVNDRRLQRLDAEAFRAYVNALMWCVANRTDGHLTGEDLPLVPHFGKHAAALVEAGLWMPEADGWLIADFESTQTSAHDLGVLENMRRLEREKKARQRAEASARGDSPGGPSRGSVPGDTTGRQDRQARTDAPAMQREVEGVVMCAGGGHVLQQAYVDRGLTSCVKHRYELEDRARAG